MKKIFLFLLFSTFLKTTLLAQRIECIAAANYNLFYRIGANSDSHAIEDYKNGFGYAFSIGIDEIKISKTSFRFTLKYDHYTGGVNYDNYAGHGDGNKYDLNVKKDVLGFGIYPINATFFHHLKLSVGTEFNFLIHAQQSGNQSSWQLTPNGPSPYTTSSSPIDNNSKNINRVFNFGINTSVRYEFALSDNLWIAPQAMLYLSMANEFTSSFNNTKSFRPYLGIALIKNLKKNN